MIRVNTWCENTKEGINYLQYNGYGKVVRIGRNTFLCSQRGKNLTDVTIKSR